MNSPPPNPLLDAVLAASASGAAGDFFELVRLIEHALAAPTTPDAPPRALRFAHAPELTFPSSEVASIAVDRDAVTVAVSFLGILGVASPLTPEWTEEVLHADEDGMLRAFYDVFLDRAVALLFSAWKAHAVEGGFDLRGDDALSKRLRSLAGVDAWAAEDEGAVPPMAAVGLADHQRGQPQTIDAPSAEALFRRMFPDWNVRLEVAVPRFAPFSQTERARLGLARCRLGADLVYGDGYHEAESLVRLRIGPVDRATYEALMPGGASYARLERIADWVFVAAVDVELDVDVAAGDAPTATLGQKDGCRLGVDTRYTTSRGAALRVRVPLVRPVSSHGHPERAQRTFVVL